MSKWLSVQLVFVLAMTSGCSVYMAAKQPEAKDLSVIEKGTPRNRIIAELGAPVWSGEKNDKKVDVFAFKQGYSAGAKTGRAVMHGVFDVFSLGLWEVVGTPVESYASGTDMKLEVTYDGNDQVESVMNFTTKEQKLGQTEKSSTGSE